MAHAWRHMVQSAGSVAHVALPSATGMALSSHPNLNLMDQLHKKSNPTVNRRREEDWEKKLGPEQLQRRILEI